MVAETETSAELTTAEAAALAGVSDRTIRNWIKEGRLPAERTEEGRRVRKGDLLVLLHERVQAVAGQLPLAEAEAATAETATETVAAAPAAETSPETVTALLAKLSAMLEQAAAERPERERLHRENLELAGRIGFLQAKLQEAEHKVFLLQAPAETATAAETAACPWWKRLFAWPSGGKPTRGAAEDRGAGEVRG